MWSSPGWSCCLSSNTMPHQGKGFARGKTNPLWETSNMNFQCSLLRPARETLSHLTFLEFRHNILGALFFVQWNLGFQFSMGHNISKKSSSLLARNLQLYLYYIFSFFQFFLFMLLRLWKENGFWLLIKMILVEFGLMKILNILLANIYLQLLYIENWIPKHIYLIFWLHFFSYDLWKKK